MCINVYKIILLVCICCVGIFWISCSGNSDDSEQTEVILSVNKNTLIADGKDFLLLKPEPMLLRHLMVTMYPSW